LEFEKIIFVALVYTFSRGAHTCADLQVHFTVSGTALFGTDYSQSGASSFSGSTGSVLIPNGSISASVSITPIDNGAMGGNKTVILALASSPSNYTNNASNNSQIGTITDDETPQGISLTCQGATISIAANGTATVVAANLNAGVTNGTMPYTFTATPASFTCAAVGSPQNVVLKVTDAGPNTATCNASVTVQDNIAPTANCPASIADVVLNGLVLQMLC